MASSQSPNAGKSPEQIEAERKARIEYFKKKHTSKTGSADQEAAEGIDEQPVSGEVVTQEDGGTYKQVVNTSTD